MSRSIDWPASTSGVVALVITVLTSGGGSHSVKGLFKLLGYKQIPMEI